MALSSKMAPLHHHFEKLGWSEVQVTQRFWIVAIIAGLVALILAGSSMKTHPLLAELKDKRITIIGLAREGLALTRFLANLGAQVTASDLKTREQLQDTLALLADLPVHYVLGEHPVSLLDADLVFLSPGYHWISRWRAARERNEPLSTETRLFLEWCPAPVIGVTGSSGKTTTVSLVGEMCKAAGTAYVGRWKHRTPADRASDRGCGRRSRGLGAIQFSVGAFAAWGAERARRARMADLSRGASPHIAAVLNITPNHLHRHASMEEYTSAKANILRYQSAGDYAILSQDDPTAWGLRERVHGQLLTISAYANKFERRISQAG